VYLLKTAALPTLSGGLYFLSWIGFGIWPLAFVCFLPLLWSLRDATLRQALGRGAWMGFVAHLGGYTWVVHLLQVFAFVSRPVAFLGYLLLCAAQGFLFGVFALALRWAWTIAGWPLAALLPLVLCATEYTYPLLFQSYTGVALMPLLATVQIADLGGALLLTALQALVNGAVADALFALTSGRPLPVRPLLAAGLAVLLSTTYGAWRIERVHTVEGAAPARTVGLVQPNVGGIELHGNPYASVSALWSETRELQGRSADLVIWPEVGFNLRPVRATDDGRAIQGGAPVSVIAGVQRTDGKSLWNSAIAISADGRIGDHFDKIQLLAFGEYVPLGDLFPVLYKWSPLASHLTPGTSAAPLHASGYRFATFICYEDILPRIVRRIMDDQGEGRANALVNLTNDSWYGAGHEQEQHLMLAAVRSIEHRRWLLRATSTGISAFVDATGRVVQRIPADKRGVALAKVPMIEGTTPYEVMGDWPGVISCAALAILAIGGLVRCCRGRRRSYELAPAQRQQESNWPSISSPQREQTQGASAASGSLRLAMRLSAASSSASDTQTDGAVSAETGSPPRTPHRLSPRTWVSMPLLSNAPRTTWASGGLRAR
jgi:apolipoprotein N-acyltransferase